MVDVGATAGQLFGGVLDVSAAILLGLILFILIAAAFYYFFIYRRKFDIKARIISERASDPRIFFDNGAIIKDGKGNKYFKLFKTKVQLAVPPFKVLEHTNEGDYLDIWRKSEDEFAYLTKPKIDKLRVIREDGRLYKIARTEQRHLESDLYWISKRKEDNKRLLDPESILMKLLMYAPQIMMAIILVILGFILLDKLPDVFNEVTKLIKELRALQGGMQ